MNFISRLLLLGILLLGFISPSANAEAPYWKQRNSLFEILPVYKSDIVFLGNSITDGGEFNELFKRDDIKNRGISSDVILGVKKRLKPVLKNHPRKVFLLIGINDVSHHIGVNKLEERYEALVKEIHKQSPETKLYIQSLMPIDNSFARYKNLLGEEKTIIEFNDRLKTIAEKYGDVYIDLWPALADPETGKMKKGFTNDGLHLTGNGYRAWADYLQPYVEE